MTKDESDQTRLIKLWEAGLPLPPDPRVLQFSPGDEPYHEDPSFERMDDPGPLDESAEMLDDGDDR